MKFKRGKFLIQFIPEAANQFEWREGWISSCGRYGFHKDRNKWIVSDLASGMRIYKAPTRVACAEYCETFKGHIAAAKGSEKYHNAVKALYQYKKGREE